MLRPSLIDRALNAAPKRPAVASRRRRQHLHTHGTCLVSSARSSAREERRRTREAHLARLSHARRHLTTTGFLVEPIRGAAALAACVACGACRRAGGRVGEARYARRHRVSAAPVWTLGVC